jgi:hypothetical protein
MPEPIYLVANGTKEMTSVRPVKFSEIGIRERQDLQEWIINHPLLLGEDLLVITSEFSGFKGSDRRLDILALDKTGKLVVVELKLDTIGSLADLQAIRYAAFCSTMVMADIVRELASFSKCSEDEASDRLHEFLDVEELPELDNQPRIILGAGSMNDAELTSSVLWLRGFEMDITCVELTPYIIQETGQIILVPNVLIPLPEARDYQIKVESKEATRARDVKAKVRYSQFWAAVGEEFNALNTGFSTSGRCQNKYMQISVGTPKVHYEWVIGMKPPRLRVALHFEYPDKERNQRLIEGISKKSGEIEESVKKVFECGPFGKKWSHAQFTLPCEGPEPTVKLAPQAAELMKTLIDRTWPIVEPALQNEGLL